MNLLITTKIPVKWGKLHCFTIPVIEEVEITPEVLETVRKANEMIDFARGHLDKEKPNA